MDKRIIDPATLEEVTLMDSEGISEILPQSFEMRQVDRVIHLDRDRNLIVGVKEIRKDEFWVRGHIPGRPIMPGVIIIEACAQLASLYYQIVQSEKERQFIGMGAVDRVRFRGVVVPGDRLLLVARNRAIRSRAAFFDVQAFVGERVVFEGSITGVKV